jgi:hypothetical protein
MKRVLILSIILIIAISGFLSAATLDETKTQVKRSAYYTENYEAGNFDYAKLLVYLGAVQEDLNYLLRISGDQALSEADLTALFGTPEKTNWILSDDGTTQIQTDTQISVWSNIIFFDGNTIQLRISIVPISIKDKISYKAEFSTIFKESVSEASIHERIKGLRVLAETYALNPEDLQSANKLAKESVNIEKLFESYSQQTDKQCSEIFLELFGKENQVSEEKIVVETYEVHERENYRVLAAVSICEDCTITGGEKWIGLDMVLEKDGQKIMYPLTEPVSESLFADMEINGLKAEAIRLTSILNDLLEGGNYKSAYTIMQRMEVLNKVWNEQANDGDSSFIAQNFVDRVQFYGKLFENYGLAGNYFYTQSKFKEIIYRELGETGDEICTNNIDDNTDEKIDCEDQLCTGQVCGTKTVITTENNQTTERQVELYCVSGLCQEKEEPVARQITSVCGNNICEPGESGPEAVCAVDCSQNCVAYEPVVCSGKLIFGGVDESGCPLPPVCVALTTSCSTSNDCTQPLCGKSECISGSCQLTSLDKCSQAKCVDGQEKTQKCEETGKTIVTEICSNGVWEITGLKCSIPREDIIVEENAQQTTYSCSQGCPTGYVCSLGECKLLPVNQPGKDKQGETVTETGVTFTGKVIEITGEPITATGITSVVGPEPDFETDINVERIPQRIYEEGERPSSPLTGIIGNLRDEEIELPEETSSNSIIDSETSNLKLGAGISEEFAVNGLCRDSKYEKNSVLYLTSVGEDFETIDRLLESYQEKGSDWCSWELEKIIKKRKQIVNSLDNAFARWFFEDYIANNAEDWVSKKEALLNVYSEITENEKDMAYMMDCLDVKELSSYSLISLNYENDYGSLKISEEIKEAKFPGMVKQVKIPHTSMEASLFLSRDLVKNILTKDLNAHEFPSASQERKVYEGLTSEEIIAFKNDAELKSKISEIIPEYKDGYIDAQVNFVSTNENGEEATVYNIYVRLNENEFLIAPLLPEETPSIDVKITMDYNEVYTVMFVSEENAKETLTRHPPWDQGGIRPIESVNLAFNWVESQFAVRSMMNSAVIYPEKPGIREILRDSFFLLAEN